MSSLMSVPRSLAVILGIGLATAGAGAEEAVVFRADFEAPSASSPPPGWAMWGASRYKVPANYTRDTAQPHAGEACFRIHHPSGTEGYVVSDPQSAIRPKPGMMYTLTFWARSDRPGPAVFGWSAYRQTRPLADAPSPGFSSFTVESQWKEFRFTLHEGWDFFVAESPYLLLTFKAGAKEEARTLWLDDVAVVEQPSAREGRLVNPATLDYPPLEHGVRPGDELAVTVDAAKRLREAPREVGGVSFHRVAGWPGVPYDKAGRYVLAPELEEAVRQLHLPMTRFYALGDEPFGLEGAIDRAAEFCGRIGVPQAAVPLEFEIQGATRKLSPEAWAAGVRHSLAKGYDFRYWEITNEPYVDRPGGAFPSADDYLEHFLAVSRAVRRAHPEARIGMPINHRSPAWSNYLLKRAAGHYDFVAGHYYCFTDVQRNAFEDVVLASNYALLDEILKVNALLETYNPGREVFQYDTEWGMHSRGPEGERADDVRRNANVVGMMHRAVRLICYLRSGMLRGASSWEMFAVRRAPGFSFLPVDAPQQRSMLYWLYYHFNRHAGRWVLAVDGTAPFYRPATGEARQAGPLTPLVATLSDDEQRLFLMAANGSWEQEVSCRIDLRNFPARHAEATVLAHGDRDADPLLSHPEELVGGQAVSLDGPCLTTTLPPHAVVFITLER